MNLKRYLKSDDRSSNPRATLYQAISSITSENVEEVLENLETVDPDQLSPRDRRLLLAARAIAAEVLALPTGVEPSVEEASQPAVSKTMASHASEAAGEETLAHTPTGSEEHPAPAISAEAALSGKPSEEVDTVSQELVSSVREKLDAVDRLLGEVEKGPPSQQCPCRRPLRRGPRAHARRERAIPSPTCWKAPAARPRLRRATPLI